MTATAPNQRPDVADPLAYEAYLVPRLFAPVAARLVDRVRPEEDDHVLDLACGTGIVARYAAPMVGRMGRVIGVDADPAMIDFARTYAAGAGIDWRVGDAAFVRVAAGAIDVVTCGQGWQFFSDQSAVAAELARVTRKHARVGIAMWRPLHHNPGFARLAHVVRDVLGEEAAAIVGAPFRGPHDSVLAGELRAAGFKEVQISTHSLTARFGSVGEFVRQQAAGSSLGPLLAAADPDVTEVVAAALAVELAAYADKDGLALPMETWLVTAVRGPRG